MSLFSDPRFWVAVAFTLFFLIFGKRVVQVVIGMLDKRAADIRAELEEASRLRREAEAMLKDATAQREAALRDAQAMLEHAKAEAAQVAETARADAQAAATRRERTAHERIGAAEKAAVSDVRLAAADIAARAAERVIARNFDADADLPLIDRAIQGLPAALSGRRAA